MAIAHAMKFLKEIDERPDLRDSLYACQGLDAVWASLKDAGYPFSGGEFEEAVDHMHCDCQSYEAADQLMSKVTWLRMVLANA